MRIAIRRMVMLVALSVLLVLGVLVPVAAVDIDLDDPESLRAGGTVAGARCDLARRQRTLG